MDRFSSAKAKLGVEEKAYNLILKVPKWVSPSILRRFIAHDSYQFDIIIFKPLKP
jgi:hypothetical protein|tara:strand:+ start:3050 stop:3214 length:165 start_codon:yes stop_codon:yes gene_type:complete